MNSLRLSKKTVLLIAVFISISSCKKPIMEIDPNFIGEWYGQISARPSYLSIDINGEGYFSWPIPGDIFIRKGEVVANKTHLKIGGSKYEILKFPTRIDSTIVNGKPASWLLILKYNDIFAGGIYFDLYRE
jgi:hypothetical protein